MPESDLRWPEIHRPWALLLVSPVEINESQVTSPANGVSLP